MVNTTHYSGWDYYSADGGLISNSYDLSLFLEKLFEGAIIAPQTLDEMLTWVAPLEPDEDEFTIFYGLGIFKIETEFGPAYSWHMKEVLPGSTLGQDYLRKLFET